MYRTVSRIFCILARSLPGRMTKDELTLVYGTHLCEKYAFECIYDWINAKSRRELADNACTFVSRILSSSIISIDFSIHFAFTFSFCNKFFLFYNILTSKLEKKNLFFILIIIINYYLYKVLDLMFIYLQNKFFYKVSKHIQNRY